MVLCSFFQLIFQLQSTNDYDEVQGNTVIVSTANKILKEAILEINAEIEKFQNTKVSRGMTSNSTSSLSPPCGFIV